MSFPNLTQLTLSLTQPALYPVLDSAPEDSPGPSETGETSESSPFLQAPQSDIGIPTPSQAPFENKEPDASRLYSDLKARELAGKLLKWHPSWTFFTYTHKEIALPDQKKFINAVMTVSGARPIAYFASAPEKSDETLKYARDWTDYANAYHHALEVPVQILGDEVSLLPIENQIKFMNAAIKEIEQLPIIKERTWKRREVSRNFKSHCLLQLMKNAAAQFNQEKVSPQETDLFTRVRDVTQTHLLPFSATGDKSYPFVSVLTGEESSLPLPEGIIYMNPKDLASFQKEERKKSAIQKDPIEQRFQTWLKIEQGILSRVSPAILEEEIYRIQTSLDHYLKMLVKNPEESLMSQKFREALEAVLQIYRSLNRSSYFAEYNDPLLQTLLKGRIKEISEYSQALQESLAQATRSTEEEYNLKSLMFNYLKETLAALTS